MTKTKTVPNHIDWLEAEYPKGIELVYIDYRDHYEDALQLQNVLKQQDDIDTFYNDDGSYETMSEVIKNYKTENNISELSDDIEQEMRDWMQEHNTSNTVRDLLRNTGRRLCYIETQDTTDSYEDISLEEWDKQKKQLIKKYARTPEQKKEIEYVLANQFYGAPVSFYFYVDVENLYNAINSDKKYIVIYGAYFSTIDRVQGSNWLGNKGCFQIAIPREQFIQTFFLDKAKGNGYGWDSIAGQTDYDEATITTVNTKKELGNILLLESKISEAQAREQRLQQNWDRTKTCIFGDMNWNRHIGPKDYSNNYPCGNKCQACGTFWID